MCYVAWLEFFSGFKVNASKRLTQGDQIVRLKIFAGRNRIIAGKGDFKPGAEKITEFISESTGIGPLNVFIIRKREVDFQPFQGIGIRAGCLAGFSALGTVLIFESKGKDRD